MGDSPRAALASLITPWPMQSLPQARLRPASARLADARGEGTNICSVGRTEVASGPPDSGGGETMKIDRRTDRGRGLSVHRTPLCLSTQTSFLNLSYSSIISFRKKPSAMRCLRNGKRHTDGAVAVNQSTWRPQQLSQAYFHPRSCTHLLGRPCPPARAGWWAEPPSPCGALPPCSALPLRMTRSFHRGIRRQPPFSAPCRPPRPAAGPRTLAPRTAETGSCPPPTPARGL